MATFPATPTMISVEEYLQTNYRPDCDYVDGEVQERNRGEKPHSRLQTFFIRFFSAREDEWGIEVLPEQRVQAGITRFRIPDVMLARLPNHGPEHETNDDQNDDPCIVRTPPLLCIEILSSGDRMNKVQERLDDPREWVCRRCGLSIPGGEQRRSLGRMECCAR